MSGTAKVEVQKNLVLRVECEADWCASSGVPREVTLPEIQPGVVALPMLRCSGCGSDLRKVEEARQREEGRRGQDLGAR